MYPPNNIAGPFHRWQNANGHVHENVRENDHDGATRRGVIALPNRQPLISV